MFVSVNCLITLDFGRAYVCEVGLVPALGGLQSLELRHIRFEPELSHPYTLCGFKRLLSAVKVAGDGVIVRTQRLNPLSIRKHLN